MHNLALAIQQKAGYIVTGSDDEIFDPARTHLEQAGLLPKQMGWHPERITPDIDAIILGMHAREDNPELVRARELGLRIYSFPEYLYEQSGCRVYGGWAVPKACFNSWTMLPFEGTLFQCPGNSDLYLRTIYHDYMKLPPESERENRHQILEVQL